MHRPLFDLVTGLSSRESPGFAQECVDQLVLAALDGGGSDNITAILLRNDALA